MPDFGPECWRATEKPDSDAVEWSLIRWNCMSADDRKTSYEEKTCGMKAQRDEALAFYGAAPRFFMTGDCEKVANLQAGNRSAMGKVAQL